MPNSSSIRTELLYGIHIRFENKYSEYLNSDLDNKMTDSSKSNPDILIFKYQDPDF